jgi:hypothetical protein
LEQEGHSAEPKLKEVCRTLTEVLRPLHEELLNSVAPIQTLVNHWGPTIPEWAEISNPPKTLPAILASSAGFKIGRKPENQFPAR